MKRFYKTVSVEGDGGFRVLLDGKAVKTPGRNALALPGVALAEAIAGEWRAQEATIEPATMPLMRIAATAIDRVSRLREEVIGQVVAFGDADLLCYRAERPAELVARQAEEWDALLDRLQSVYGVRLDMRIGIAHVAQVPAALAKLRHYVGVHDDHALAALHTATAASGSLVIGLLMSSGDVDGFAAWRATRVDEDFQAEVWGQDADATASADAVRRALFAAGVYLRLTAPSPPG